MRHIFIVRLMPLGIVAAVAAMLAVPLEETPFWVSFIGLLGLYWMNIPIFWTVTVDRYAVSIQTFHLLWWKQQDIPVADAAAIELEVYTRPRGAGAFYRLVMKNGTLILFLKLPVAVFGSNEKLLEVSAERERHTVLTDGVSLTG